MRNLPPPPWYFAYHFLLQFINYIYSFSFICCFLPYRIIQVSVFPFFSMETNNNKYRDKGISPSPVDDGGEFTVPNSSSVKQRVSQLDHSATGILPQTSHDEFLQVRMITK